MHLEVKINCAEPRGTAQSVAGLRRPVQDHRRIIVLESGQTAMILEADLRGGWEWGAAYSPSHFAPFAFAYGVGPVNTTTCRRLAQ